jgi:GST-like protein
MLEEIGLPYRIHLVDLQKGEQLRPQFLAINPNNKIPALIDPQGPDGKPFTIWESGAILIYLAEKTRSALLPASGAARFQVLQWLMFQMAGIGPMLGQAGHFTLYAKETVPYGVERYSQESKRLLGVMDKQLSAHDYIAGANYSIADIAIYPWTQSALRIPTIGSFAAWPAVGRWRERVAARPAVQRGLANPARD